MTPYYESPQRIDGQPQVRIFNARWEDVWPTLGLKPADVALCWADPPYGINYLHGDWRGASVRKVVVGDDAPFDPSLLLAFPRLVAWGANHYASKVPDSPAWWTWDKREGSGVGPDQSDCELAWTNIGRLARLFSCVWSGTMRGSERGVFIHPTQKPVALAEWGFKQAGLKPGQLVFAPYLGSGPEVRAALNMGLRIIGCEVDADYCRTVVEHRCALAAPKRGQEGQALLPL